MEDPFGRNRQTEALAFGTVAAEYDRYRPTYPPAALQWALGAEPLRVVDLGAGTGLLTRVLLRLGHHVIAVDPDPRMRAQLSASSDLLQPRAGSAEAIPLPDESVDAVVAGQAYHWFDPDKALPEIARVLRAGGVFAPLWNLRDDSVPWVAELSRVANGLPRRDGSYTAAFEYDFGPLFHHTERTAFRHAVSTTADSLLAMIRTRSWYLTASPAVQAEIERGVTSVTARLPATFDLPYLTWVHRTRRQPVPR
jgi:SAM-dependent methyltransferase